MLSEEILILLLDFDLAISPDWRLLLGGSPQPFVWVPPFDSLTAEEITDYVSGGACELAELIGEYYAINASE